MRFFASSADACPSTDSVPESGNRIAMIIRIVVVLPAPLGPMKPYSAPRGIARSRSATAFVAPNVLLTLLSVIASFMALESTPPAGEREARRDLTRFRLNMFRSGGVLLAAALAFSAQPAAAQISLSGDWGPRMHEDQPDRGPGPALGDYTGLPITDGARLAADSWDAARLTLREHQCKVH